MTTYETHVSGIGAVDEFSNVTILVLCPPGEDEDAPMGTAYVRTRTWDNVRYVNEELLAAMNTGMMYDHVNGDHYTVEDKVELINDLIDALFEANPSIKVIAYGNHDDLGNYDTYINGQL